MGVLAKFEIFEPWVENLRTDEDEVRVLLVEDSGDYAELVEDALGRARRGHFAIQRAEDVEAALLVFELQSFDVLLLDLDLADEDHETTIELASTIAHLIPVIVLTGSASAGVLARGVGDLPIRRRLDRAELPAKILHAVRRHRRLGSGGVDPVVCRFPDH
jgi:DNA-binding response OmpR family regulator